MKVCASITTRQDNEQAIPAMRRLCVLFWANEKVALFEITGRAILLGGNVSNVGQGRLLRILRILAGLSGFRSMIRSFSLGKLVSARSVNHKRAAAVRPLKRRDDKA